MIRRKKDSVLTQLPPKFRQKVSIEIPAKSRKVINRVKRDLDEIKSAFNSLTAHSTFSPSSDLRKLQDTKFHHLRLINELFRDTGRAKLPAVLSYLKENFFDREVEDGSMPKLVVFAHHLDIIDGIEHELNRQRIGHIRVSGSTDPSTRGALVDLFQTDPTVKVAVLSIQAAGVGLTLTASAHVIFAEVYWNPGHLQQAEDRCHRIGQERGVTIQYLIAQGTIDDLIWNMLNRKVKVLGGALDRNEEATIRHSKVEANVDVSSQALMVCIASLLCFSLTGKLFCKACT